MESAQTEIRQSVKNVDAMIADIMDFSREVAVEVKPTALVPLLDFSIRQSAASYRHHPPAIRFHYALNHQHKPLMDDERMARALGNVLGNAMEAITVLGKRDQGCIWIHSREVPTDAGPGVEIVVGNDGPPFQEADLDKLFSSFFTKGKKKGTGLGLASVEKILRLHGGRVEARNVADGKGVELVMWVPASQERETPSNLSQALPGSLGDILSTVEKPPSAREADQWIGKIRHCTQPLKVLLLEDETLYRAAVKNVLAKDEDLRRTVIFYDANTVEGALALLSQEPEIRHAIVDIDLGEMKNGFDFLRAAQAAHPALRCMVHTNRCVVEDQNLAKALGAVSFVSKPLGLESLAALLASGLPEGHAPVQTDTLPGETPPPASISSDANEATGPVSAPAPSQPKVCYVADDSTIMRKSMEMRIQTAVGKENVTVRTFDCPGAMLAVGSQEKPDYVFCDYHFDATSSMTGIEALCQMQALCPCARLFLVSNVDDEIGLGLVDQYGLAGFIRPTDFKEKIADLFGLETCSKVH